MTETGMNASNPLDGPRLAGTAARRCRGVDPRGRRGRWCVPAGHRRRHRGEGPERLPGLLAVARAPARGVSGRQDRRHGGHFGRAAHRRPGEGPDHQRAQHLRRKSKVHDAWTGSEAPWSACPSDFGEAVVAVVVTAPGRSLEESAVIAGLKSHIARFKVPRRVHVVADLPRNAMGKVQKNVLRERYGS
jgi:malonyl-CoA/methylmalonyl-CoA synthetase